MPKIWFEVIATNGGSHFSHEDQHVLFLNFASVILLVLVLGMSIWNYFRESWREETWVNPLGMLVLAAITEFLAVFFKLCDYLVFWSNG